MTTRHDHRSIERDVPISNDRTEGHGISFFRKLCQYIMPPEVTTRRFVVTRAPIDIAATVAKPPTMIPDTPTWRTETSILRPTRKKPREHIRTTMFPNLGRIQEAKRNVRGATASGNRDSTGLNCFDRLRPPIVVRVRVPLLSQPTGRRIRIGRQQAVCNASRSSVGVSIKYRLQPDRMKLAGSPS